MGMIDGKRIISSVTHTLSRATIIAAIAFLLTA